jgi:hypothetical protein
MSNLIREWDEHVIAGNRISRDLESFDRVMKIAELPDSKVALYVNGGTTYIDSVLPEEVMGVLKTIVTNQLVDIRTRKETELKKHMNTWKPATVNTVFNADFLESAEPLIIPKKKPATMNPEFEQAVQEMEQQGKTRPDPIEEKLVDSLKKRGDRLGQQEVEAKMKQQPPLSADEILRQDIDKVRELYEDDTVTVSVIAARYGVKKTDVYTFASKNRFARMKKPSGFLDSPKKERP